MSASIRCVLVWEELLAHSSMVQRYKHDEASVFPVGRADA